VVVQPSPLEQLRLLETSIGNTIVVGRVAGRTGAMRATAPSMPPHVCPREGRRRPAPRFFAADLAIDFALVTVYGLQMILFASGPRRGFMPQRLKLVESTSPREAVRA
jgi:hypothetical protein